MVHRRWLINRMLHGEGVLCGLDVVPHERDDCAPTTVWIEPGIALDCRGRELINGCRLCVTWPVRGRARLRTTRARGEAAGHPVLRGAGRPAVRGAGHVHDQGREGGHPHPRAGLRGSWPTGTNCRTAGPSDHRPRSTMTAMTARAATADASSRTAGAADGCRSPCSPGARAARSISPATLSGPPARRRIPDQDLRASTGRTGASWSWTNSSNAAAASRSTSTGRCARRTATPPGSTSSPSGSSTAARSATWSSCRPTRRPASCRPDQGRLHDRSRPMGPRPPARRPAGHLAARPAGPVRPRHPAV